jgi:photosystem II oxygen-evolving enhancer protein 2
MLKRFFVSLLLVMTLGLQGCLAIGGLNSFVDDIDGYRFLYPNGWVQVQGSATSGLDVIFHDIIQQTENISVVINPAPGTKLLTDLGTPGEVGYQLSKSAIAPPDSGRTAELVSSQTRELADGQTYYLLEYLVTLADGRQRHNLATAGVRRGKLFTLNASTPEERWAVMKPSLEKSMQSFTIN